MPRYAMEHFVEAQNIAKFKARLKTETESGIRTTLIQLLADEEAKRDARIVANYKS